VPGNIVPIIGRANIGQQVESFLLPLAREMVPNVFVDRGKGILNLAAEIYQKIG
jgi:hypothetical protein